MSGRAVIEVTGADRETFLQGLVSNDLRGLRDGLVYAALLTPQPSPDLIGQLQQPAPQRV